MRALTFLAQRFVAGDDISDAIEAVRALNADGLKATLDNLGEDSLDEAHALAAAEENLAMLRRLNESGVDANISLKLTQLGLAFDEKLAVDSLLRVVTEAERLKTFVRIDMEGSQWTQKTLDIFYAMHEKHPGVGIVLQSALRRTEQDAKDAVDRKARVRLCKGAYREPASVAFQDKKEVDANYDRCAAILAEAPIPAMATHDDARIAAALKAFDAAGLVKADYELQMLYGIRSKRAKELRELGHTVRIYVPYGSHWFPYFYRRIRERKENLLFVVRNFFE
ncbi:MAG: proline dehydrogenase [Elusimicrobia bacterium CG11_big_fil_rev_8_21_14_0_20_64_6]|nr:MAG: proline dehydrogenase [Elusimicrobia bacterium CG11_big_fil_rev_8_21_14_0_20_64_6]